MTGDRGTVPSSRDAEQRHRLKPVLAAVVVASPLLLLLLLNAAVLVRAYADPASTCWMADQIEAGRRMVSPFEIHLLYFFATLQYWGPVILLLAALFWYVEWIRVPELLVVGALAAGVLYMVGFEYHWLAELYRSRYDLACG